MKTIWKYELRLKDGPQYLSIPKNGKILSVDTQWKTVCLWVLVDSDHKVEQRVFQVYGTGHPVETKIAYFEEKFIGTVFVAAGELVFHVFEYKIH